MKTNAKIVHSLFESSWKNVEKIISQMFSVADLLCFGIIMHQLDEL